jgi:hypothetical protein
MTRPVVQNVVRLLLVALGACCLVVPFFTMWEFRRMKTADGTVVVHPVIEYDRTNMHRQVTYALPDGTKTFVMCSDAPATARAGDHIKVVYDPQRTIDSWTLTDLLRVPAYATVLGIVLTSLGLFARRRRRVVSIESHANAA